ncbi:MBL fold metallo-hydrolase [Streptomyces sp. NPDC059262]|uniref:MBL fold metallo-hydrolase n=1 Tax=Streptomyces sp. NPDC059262 TaxID=3346797 RepID=UPI003681CEB7
MRGPGRFLTDGQRLDGPGWHLAAHWTPGHTPGHLCSWSERERALLVGDHVMPRTVVGCRKCFPTTSAASGGLRRGRPSYGPSVRGGWRRSARGHRPIGGRRRSATPAGRRGCGDPCAQTGGRYS